MKEVKIRNQELERGVQFNCPYCGAEFEARLNNDDLEVEGDCPHVPQGEFWDNDYCRFPGEEDRLGEPVGVVFYFEFIPPEPYEYTLYDVLRTNPFWYDEPDEVDWTQFTEGEWNEDLEREWEQWNPDFPRPKRIFFKK